MRRLAADDPDRQAGPREGLAPDEPLGHPELGADGPHLVLEQRAQRLDELELEVVRQPADVVVRLDRRRAGAPAGLDDVRVDRALDEVVARPRRASPPRPRRPGRTLADALAFRLRVGDAAQPVEEALLGVDGDERDAEAGRGTPHDLLALVLAHDAVVDEHAGQLVADRRVHEQRRDGRVDAAAQAADDLARRRPARGSAAICSSTIDAAVHVRSQPQTSHRKSCSIVLPYGVWTTSGWNWMP